MYWCCRTAASRLSLFSAWPHHSTPVSALNPPPPPAICDYIFSTCHFLIYIFRYTSLFLDPLWFCFWFETSHAPTPVDSSKWLRAQPTCLDRWSIKKKIMYKSFTPPFFIPFFSFTFSDRYSYYYKPPTVLVKFFAYPVTSFYTYRV